MRLGVLGGTYDPVHAGHLLLAEQARESLALDSVLLIPAGWPPHKPHAPVTPYPARLAMVSLAVAGCPELTASDLERDPSQPSYTVETLRLLRARGSGSDEIWLLMGADTLDELPTWREPEEVLKLARIAVYARPPEKDALESGERADPETLRALLAGHPVRRLEGPRLRLSSTEIRARVRDGRSIRFLVPEAVRAYILDQGLYRISRAAAAGSGGAEG